MDQIFFEGIRCFFQHHICQLKPITLLVGENSSGKTTFLALTRIAWDVTGGNLIEDIFNEEPFLLGSFDQIASLRGGRAGRAKSFTIGAKITLKQRQKTSGLFSREAVITARFVRSGSIPKLEEWTLECGQFKLAAQPLSRSPHANLTITTPNGMWEIGEGLLPRNWLNVSQVLRTVPFWLSRESRAPAQEDTVHSNDRQSLIISQEELQELQGLASQIPHSLGQRPFAFAPIRTRPRRTYDPIRDVPEPEGSHMPMVLAKFLFGQSNNSQLQQALTSFGQASGLFNSLEIKRKGHQDSDPFQISIRSNGPPFNLVDVGYGVSQVLPILVDIVQSPQNSTFLLQQPEVHLHPQAQAELGSFLAIWAKEHNKRFIIETHSDYLVDRIRMDVRDKKSISCDQICILYFEKVSGQVYIHQLDIDESGNFINVPPSYRQFFLQEERRMLGI